MRGGRRKGAGRKQNSGDKRLELVREALSENREKLIGTAVKLATGKKPHPAVLCKLLDKVLPSLAATTASVSVEEVSHAALLLSPELDALVLKEAERIRNRRKTVGPVAAVTGKAIGPDRQPG